MGASKRRRSPGEGSIYQGKDGRWYSSIETGSRFHRRRQRFVGVTRERVRQKLIAAQRKGVKRGANRKDGSKTIGELADAWLAYASKRVEHRTLVRYTSIVEHYITPALGRIPKDSLEPDAIENALSEWAIGKRLDGRKGALSPQTLRHILRVLRTLLSWGVRMREIPYNPALAIDPPRVTAYEATTLSRDEFADLLSFAQRHSSPYVRHILVAATTGLRRGELLALRLSDVDFRRLVVRVAQSVEVRKDALSIKAPKGRKPKAIAIPQLAADAIAEHVEQRRARGEAVAGDALVFGDAKGKPMRPDTLTVAFERLVRDWKGPRVRLHDLRHTYGSWLADDLTSDRVMRAQLRHASSEMSERYTRGVDVAMRAAADELQRRLEPLMAHLVAHQDADSGAATGSKRSGNP